MKTENLLLFFEKLENLKKTRRTGWVERGVKDAESVADHSFRMTVMALVLADKLNCNREKLVSLCLVHDLHEAICGDLILDFSRFGSTVKGHTPTEKKEKELTARNELFGFLDAKAKKEFEALCNEFENGDSKEALVARQLDKLEMLLQASEYQRAKNFEKEIWPIFLKANQQSKQKIVSPVLKGFLDAIVSDTN